MFNKSLCFLEFEGGVCIIELLYRSNIMVFVGSGQKPEFPPNKVLFWDDSQLKVIGEINFKSIVRGVRLREDK
jgi:WD repeat-containing protein 45